jgi:excisionase family DNA binding protein
MSESVNQNGPVRPAQSEGTTGQAKRQPNDRVEVLVNSIPVEVTVGFDAAVRRAEEAALQPLPAEMTLAQAAEFLNVSHLHLVKLLRRGEVPCQKVGKRRRIPTAALVEYREKLFEQAKKGLAEMTRLSQELGLYDLENPKRKGQ